MAETTGIPWCRSTFNAWIGCTPVGPGCDNCYAEVGDNRFFAGGHWGPGAPRRMPSDNYWAEPFKWDRKAAATGEFWPVFCASYGDVFDNEVPQQWRERLWALIRSTPHLTWLLVTKRIGNARKMLPADWGTGYPNVWLLATVVNQEEADRDITKLLAVPAAVHGLSMEPLLGPVSLATQYLTQQCGGEYPFPQLPSERRTKLIDLLDWIIIGGESRQRSPARVFKLEWAEALIGECADAGKPIFVKQMGHNASFGDARAVFTGKGANPEEWPEHLRRQEFPHGLSMELQAA